MFVQKIEFDSRVDIADFEHTAIFPILAELKNTKIV